MSRRCPLRSRGTSAFLFSDQGPRGREEGLQEATSGLLGESSWSRMNSPEPKEPLPLDGPESQANKLRKRVQPLSVISNFNYMGGSCITIEFGIILREATGPYQSTSLTGSGDWFAGSSFPWDPR